MKLKIESRTIHMFNGVDFETEKEAKTYAARITRTLAMIEEMRGIEGTCVAMLDRLNLEYENTALHGVFERLVKELSKMDGAMANAMVGYLKEDLTDTEESRSGHIDENGLERYGRQ